MEINMREHGTLDHVTQELESSPGVSGNFPSTPCQHGKWFDCLPCGVSAMNLRIDDLEDALWKITRDNKKLKKQVKKISKALLWYN